MGAVRHEITAKPRSNRSLPERLALRFPGVLNRLRVRFDRLPPSSRLRQRLIPPITRAAYAALNRHDDEIVFGLIYHPDCEFESTLAALGLENTRGRDERMQAQQRWIADWGEFRFEPEELLDLGDHRIVVLGRVNGAGLGSGAAFNDEWASVFTFSDAWIVREQTFFDHAQALEAAGLERRELRSGNEG